MAPPIAMELSVTRNDGLYYISTDRSKLDIPKIHEWISTDCYWAIGRPFDTVSGSIEDSLPFGVYTSHSAQIGFARVVTDYRTPPFLCRILSIDTFAWVDDIYVSRSHRGKGVSHFIIDTINELLRSKLGIKHIVLFTHDAQSLYERHGYKVFSEPDRQRWMSLPTL